VFSLKQNFAPQKIIKNLKFELIKYKFYQIKKQHFLKSEPKLAFSENFGTNLELSIKSTTVQKTENKLNRTIYRRNHNQPASHPILFISEIFS
jgi:hypothetical protein